ncbi:hypothetical protein [uncultured Endozoicomonas sp.]|uniref:hypothetical protein n=1 Tax=uncultured Endozoicomonas sp. TaxID=432652 RepID=UPI00261EFDD4|nr:hypothetical protein [uncultured Endozoicomonas sp.]
MKVLAVAVAGLLLAGAVQAGEKAEKEGMVCHAMGSTNIHHQPRFGDGMSPNLSVPVTPKFYVTSERDYKACRKMAAEKGAHVIIDPNA